MCTLVLNRTGMWLLLSNCSPTFRTKVGDVDFDFPSLRAYTHLVCIIPVEVLFNRFKTLQMPLDMIGKDTGYFVIGLFLRLCVMGGRVRLRLFWKMFMLLNFSELNLSLIVHFKALQMTRTWFYYEYDFGIFIRLFRLSFSLGI